MLWTNTKRISKAGFVSFWRNGFVSLSSVLIITVTLFSLGGIIFANAILNFSLDQIKDKVDVNVYFVPTADESDILSLQKKLEALPEVASVEYISSDQALANFKDRHANDQITLQALSELSDNPLGAILNIKAKQTSQYEGIAKFLDSETGDQGTFIDKINYYQNKTAIDTLTKIIDGGTKVSVAITLVLVLISILIVFNTIRLAIYTSREEIAVMRLVGASNAFVRGPFIISGIMYGIVSALITLFFFYPATFWVSKVISTFFSGFSLFAYYNANFPLLFAVILGMGVVLGAVSSFLAVRKYLKI